MVVLFVSCFGVTVDFLCCLNLMYVFIDFVKFGKLRVAYWEIATHSAYDMFSKYNYLIVNLVFYRLGF